jgi:hypothetical protein
VTAPRPTADSLVYAPLRVRINCVSTAVGVNFMVAVNLAAWVCWWLDSAWGFLYVGAPALVPTAWAVRRATRVRLVVSRHGVRIDNTWRSYELPWSRIDGVGIRTGGLVPQVVLWFRVAGRSPVVAQATPLRTSTRHAFQSEVLSFAPASVQPLADEAGWLGGEWAPSYKLRLWWLKKYPDGRWSRFLQRLGT